MSPAATTLPRRPLKPATPGQLRALHAIARRRGMTHEALREAAGVTDSLKELSVVTAGDLINRLQLEDHRTGWQPAGPDRAARGCLKLGSDRQRTCIQAVFDALGWGDEVARAWLDKRHDITDLAGGVCSTRALSKVIVELEQALLRRHGNAARSGVELA